MFFNEDHLRITKVRTNDGTTPVIGEDEKPVKKIVLAPDNPQTRKLFQDQNTRLPTNLKMKIEPIKGYKPQPISNNESANSILEQKIKELEAQNKILLEQQQKLNAEAKNLSSENGNSVVDPKKEKTNTAKNVSNETV